MTYINHELCAACKGHCCKSEPGATSPEDWGEDLVSKLTTALKSGRWQIKLFGGVLYAVPLRTDKGCVFLTATGCAMSDDERPERCRSLKPSVRFPEGCHQTDSFASFVERWRPYQEAIYQADDNSRQKVRKPMSIWRRLCKGL